MTLTPPPKTDKAAYVRWLLSLSFPTRCYLGDPMIFDRHKRGKSLACPICGKRSKYDGYDFIHEAHMYEHARTEKRYGPLIIVDTETCRDPQPLTTLAESN